MSLRGSVIVAGADHLVERRRRLGGPGGRLYPARQRHRFQARAGRFACAAATCGCWSAAARPAPSPAAFGAPLAGAFYAFELVIGTYAVASLAPVGAAALVGYLTARACGAGRLGVNAGAVCRLADGRRSPRPSAWSRRGLRHRPDAWRRRLRASCSPSRRAGRRYGRPSAGTCRAAGADLAAGAVVRSRCAATDRRLQAAVGDDRASFSCSRSTPRSISLGSGFRGGLFFAVAAVGRFGGQLFAGWR